jgi:NADH-quinone oxidoreductase subunit F
MLVDLCDNILGRAFCALGDGATSPITSSIQYFRDEYIAHLTLGRCPFDQAQSTLFTTDTSLSTTGATVSTAGAAV